MWPAAGDRIVEESLCQAGRHQQAVAKARGQAHPEHPGALQVSLCTALLQTGQGNTGSLKSSLYKGIIQSVS